MSCAFSIIIPVYNVEDYLCECLDSILTQSFEDFEVILVDDGSPDKSPVICDRYAQEDSRVKVVHKKNGGSSDARNVGLTAAKGDYIVFMDADDYWSSWNALEQVYSILQEEVDVVVIKANEYYQKTGHMKINSELFSEADFISNRYDERFAQLVEKRLYDACAWNKIFKRSLLEKTDLTFQRGIVGEDIDWAARLSLVANSISIVSSPFYVYRKEREGSVTSSLQMKNLIDTKESLERCLGYVASLETTEEFRCAYYAYVAYRYVIWLAESVLVCDNDKKKIVRQMKKYCWLLKYNGNYKVRQTYRLYCLVGYSLTRLALGLILKIKK